jgi:hypothetical protein
MGIQQFEKNPFQQCISFHVLLDHLEKVAREETGYAAERANALLKEAEAYPKLREGMSEQWEIDEHITVIKHLVADLFPAPLTHNEIKAVTIPFQNILFNRTERLKKILHAAGNSFDMTIRNFDDHQFYVMSCCLILNELYNTHLDFAKPMFYDIPTAEGVIKHYRIMYNADFLDIIPTDKARKLTPEDITRLVNSYDDLGLWMEMFPPGSYILKGFALISLFDVTIENAVSVLKGTLLTNLNEVDVEQDFESIFRSIYRIPDLRVGFTAFDADENKFSSIANMRKIKSYMLNDSMEAICTDILGPKSFAAIMGKGDFFAISDSKKFFLKHPDSELAHQFLKQNIHSFILAPVIKDGVKLGILELASPRPNELNSVNARKLDIVMPFLVNTIDRQISFMQNRIQAVIQNEYTTLHPSVQWKFRKEAQKFIERADHHLDYTLREVVFDDVYPLYGQIDIKGSSNTRNLSIQKDLHNQLAALMLIVEMMDEIPEQASYMEKLREFETLTHNFLTLVRTDTEQYIQYFIESKIHPLLYSLRSSPIYSKPIANYFKQLDKTDGSFYTYRRKYHTTVSVTNQKMASLLDSRQTEAQRIFPHYYERFKTDGVEHNLYIGPSIAPKYAFTLQHLHKLRLWQLQTLCEMERAHHQLKTTLPYLLEVTTLILAFSSPLSIRFRMDEKRFDVDGTYNARFEIVKKRIDKAYIKDTSERICQAGKITIVYASPNEETEYRGYVKAMQESHLLDSEIEVLEVEDLQSVSGLKALRVSILHE